MKFLKNIKEGVGDKYLLRKYPNMVDDFDEFNKTYNNMKLTKNNAEITHSNGDWKLVKNPNTIKDFGKGVRGVILLNGDFYCENFSKGTIHNNILEILYDKDIIKGVFKRNWGGKTPQESGFLTVQRYKDTDYIAIGESNRLIYDEGNWEEKISQYDVILKNAKNKNPNILFTNKLVGVKYPGVKAIKMGLIDENFDFDQTNLMKTYLKNKI